MLRPTSAQTVIPKTIHHPPYELEHSVVFLEAVLAEPLLGIRLAFTTLECAHFRSQRRHRNSFENGPVTGL